MPLMQINSSPPTHLLWVIRDVGLWLCLESKSFWTSLQFVTETEQQQQQQPHYIWQNAKDTKLSTFGQVIWKKGGGGESFLSIIIKYV